ncbi:Putative SGNH hydrolase-type esterase domain, SGNH hydrolase superfamily [Septoria linicola]|uniref:SGNH hydrolase-type esterase domain, SGNH hydrolase superfamily n=1 Tax=Septoria linicola TaxID=215465 RepID=A0A9Q9EQ55_9PEZI|nr:Putative SGNH hydrolase-type esterase domain, SGNH hydrolase superfamily [Septoria linicola]
MQGLTGCTAIITSSRGIWAGHLWEGSLEINGPSAFTERFKLGEKGQNDRPSKEFQAVAVDIFGASTTARQKEQRPLWISLADLKRDKDDPFQDGADAEIFLLTKADKDDLSMARYPERIAQLRKKFRQLVPGSNYEERVYSQLDKAVPAVIRGVIAVQYSPYDHDGDDEDCTPQARVRVFNARNREPAIDKSWAATGSQVSTKRKRNACKPRDSWPIQNGYVAFGDSYAAGMGTGVTTSDACRIGTANVGDLLHAYTNNSNVDYQRRMCSGDTTTGLNRQIDEWTNPQKADLATLTMGGNDVGFSDIVWYCVVDPVWVPWYTSSNCNGAKEKAIKMMKDEGKDGIKAKLSAAYRRILEKSSREDFHLYVSGYPSGFWNTDDIQPLDCKSTTFNYWRPSYCPHVFHECYGLDNIYLEVNLRTELNGLVYSLNQVIYSAIQDFNSAMGQNQVHFVDVARYYDNHRWCEPNSNPEFHEPMANRSDTWFFLSGWPDVGATSAIGALTGKDPSEIAEIAALVSKGKIELPAPDRCDSEQGTDPDPYSKWLCRVSQNITADPQGILAKTWKAANDDISAKNLNSQSIGFFTPTNQVKTFHPRTPGMMAYRDSIVEAIKNVQTFGASAVSPPPRPVPSQPKASPSPNPEPAAPPATPNSPQQSSPAEPVLGQLECHPASNGHVDVDSGSQAAFAEEACAKSDSHTIKPGDASANIHHEPVEFPGYIYDVYWTDDCQGDEMNAGKPLAGPETCASLLSSTYKNCNNGGTGGKIRAGCLTYDFSVGKK